MALQAPEWMFEEDAPDTTNPLFHHNAVVRDNLWGIVAIKQAIQDEDPQEVAMLWHETPQQIRDVLWTAPSKGGMFTTKERQYIQSDLVGSFMREYVREKE
jgi:curli biogenesis system outer membrane secretion channel CsgG